MPSKKPIIVSLIGFILLLSTIVTAKEYLYNESIYPKQYVDILETMIKSKFWVNYDDSKNNFIFYSKESMGQIEFQVNTTFIDSMIKIIDKYNKWNIKASAKGVKLVKRISELKTGQAHWKWGNEWNTSAPIYIYFSFFSQTTQRHQLVLEFDKMHSPTDYEEHLDHQPKTLYFDYIEAMKLKKIFSKSNFELFLKNLRKKKMIYDEFK